MSEASCASSWNAPLKTGVKGAHQKPIMMERAVATLRDLRHEIRMPTVHRSRGRGQAHAIERDWRKDDQVKTSFLIAAAMIRDFRA